MTERDGTDVEYEVTEDVTVDSEITVTDRGDDSERRLDLLVYVDDAWYFCIELKVTAGERTGQTRDVGAVSTGQSGD